MQILDEQTFESAVQTAYDIVVGHYVHENRQLEELSTLTDHVFIKQRNGATSYVNDSYREFWKFDSNTVGMVPEANLDPSVVDLARRTDGLLNNYVSYLDCIHQTRGPDGIVYEFRTAKKSLWDLETPKIVALGVSRPLRILTRPDEHSRFSFIERWMAYQAFRPRDQEICRIIATGSSNKETAEALHMSTRAIELRRQTIFHALRITTSAELVALLARFQEQGLCDLGL